MGFERQQFTFYRSFLNIIEQLPDRKQREFMLVLIRYALNETEPITKDSTIRAAFEGLRPILDKARNKAKSGKIGGEASVENRKQNRSKPEANRSKPEAEGEKEKEKEKEIQYEGEEEGNSPALLPGEKAEAFHEAFEALRRCGVYMEDKDNAECEALLVEYGVKAIVEATEKARDQNVPRWPYIRKIVTTGGVGRQGGAGFTSRRVRESNEQCQKHNEVPPPDSVMGRAIREMLNGAYDDEEGGQT